MAEPAAAEDPFGIQEIVVTAQRREQSQQDVPIAVSALNAASLEQMGIDSVSDLAATAMPGLTVIPFAGSPSALSLNIRGVSTSDPTAGLYDPGVAVYSEGIPEGPGRRSGS